jgi:molybdenum cofactor cytidylyltransferase
MMLRVPVYASSMANPAKAKTIEGILLAAGESRRMGFPKPLLRINGRTFLNHVADSMLTVVGRLVIVLGAHRDAVGAALPTDNRITVVENPEYRLGQISSIKCGLRAVGASADAAIVHLVDHPTVRPVTFSRLVQEYESSCNPIVVVRYDGRGGHPVLFDRSVFAELERAPLEIGARAVLKADPTRVWYVDVEDPGVLLDLDTPDDLLRAGFRPPVRGS